MVQNIVLTFFCWHRGWNFSMGYFFWKLLRGNLDFSAHVEISFPLRVEVSRIVAIVPYTPPLKKDFFPWTKWWEDEKTRRRSVSPFWRMVFLHFPRKIRQLKMWNLLWIDWWVGWLKSGGDYFPPAFKSPMVFNRQKPWRGNGNQPTSRGWIVTIFFFEGAWMPLLLWFDAERWRVFDHLGVGSEP